MKRNETWAILVLGALGGALASGAFYKITKSPLEERPQVIPVAESATNFDLELAVKGLKTGQTLTIPPGTYTLKKRLFIDQKNIQIVGSGSDGTIIEGKNLGPTEDCFFLNGGAGVGIRDLRIQNCGRNGIFAAGFTGPGLTVQNVKIFRAGKIGLLTGAVDQVLIENSEFAESRQDHGIYISESARGVTLRNNFAHGNMAAGIQTNCVPSNHSVRSFCTDLRVEGNRVERNGKRGGAGINTMGVVGGRITGNILRDNLAGGISLYDDGAGAKFCTRDTILEGNEITFQKNQGRYGIQVTKGCTGNSAIDNRITITDALHKAIVEGSPLKEKRGNTAKEP
jgi:hypothetical protein